jgi:glycosyltransferase involved in cell wall biosynthesis
VSSTLKISIITVVLNNRAHIGECIQSVSSQTFADIEHIVIDGGSTDGTADIIKNCGNKISRWVSEPDRGIYDAMNKGLAMASGEVIGFLNADDVYAAADVLGVMAAAMGDPDIDACYSDLVYVDRHDFNKVVRYWRSRPLEPGLFQGGWVPAHPTFFVRKKIYDQYGGFDLQYKLAADFELMARFLEFHKIRAVYIPRILVKMRAGGATNRSIANIVKQNFEIVRACRKNGIGISLLSFLMRKFRARVHQFSLKPAL